MVIKSLDPDPELDPDLKGIFQPFELGGETRLIRYTVKY